MKCIRLNDVQDAKPARLPNALAAALVRKGQATYIAKKEWKKARKGKP